MNDYTLKKIEDYSGQNFLEVKDSLSFLNVLGHQKFFEISKNNFWYLVDNISLEIENKNDRTYWFAEESVIKMIDLGNLRLAYNLLKDVTLITEFHAEDSGLDHQEPGDEESERFFKDLDLLFLSEDGRKIIIENLEAHPEKFFTIRKKLDELIPILEQLLFEVNVVGSFLDLYNERQIYTVEQMIDILVGENEDYDVLSAIYTLRQDFGHVDGREIAFYFAKDNFDTINEGRYDWYNAVLMNILSNLIYFNLNLLGDDLQVKTLKENFYKAILLGCPVRKSIEKVLYETKNFADYAIASNLYVDALRSNIEKINLESKDVELSSIFIKYYKDLNDATDFSIMKKYIETVFGNDAKDYVKNAVLECLDIFVNLQESKLIDHNSSQELPENEIYFNQLEQITLLFANRVNWPKMTDLLKEKDGNYVSVKLFLKGYEKAADLGDEVVLSKFMEFNDFLKKQNLLPVDKDIIEYHEMDNKFHWADWILK